MASRSVFEAGTRTPQPRRSFPLIGAAFDVVLLVGAFVVCSIVDVLNSGAAADDEVLLESEPTAWELVAYAAALIAAIAAAMAYPWGWA